MEVGGSSTRSEGQSGFPSVPKRHTWSPRTGRWQRRWRSRRCGGRPAGGDEGDGGCAAFAARAATTCARAKSAAPSAERPSPTRYRPRCEGDDNFAWGTLRLDLGESLTLADGDPSTPGGALYVGTLDLGGGLGQLADLAGNGLSVYYDPSSAGSDYLAGEAYALPGGGVLAPVGMPLDMSSLVAVPEPGTMSLAAAVALGLLARGRRRQFCWRSHRGRTGWSRVSRVG